MRWLLRPVLLTCLSLLAWAVADGEVRAWPDIVAERTEGAIVLRFEGHQLVYVDGLGWLDGLTAPPPRIEDGRVVATVEVARALGVRVEPTATAAAHARLVGVRSSGELDLRLVLDVDGVPAAALADLEGVGRHEGSDAWSLWLPVVSALADLPSTLGPLRLRWEPTAAGVRLSIGGPSFAYDVFALNAPTRLVLDLRPDRDGVPAPTEATAVLATGVTYRSFRANGAAGPTWVHALEIAPGVGQWRVVGASGEARPTITWADGGFAAINGGYFDVDALTAIGLLVLDGTWLSMPSRNRAVVAFFEDRVVIDRVSVRYGVRVDERVVLDVGHEAAAMVRWLPSPGERAVGAVSEGVLVLDAAGRVVANRVGPVAVPVGGRALTYPPDLRALALVDPGAVVAVDVRVTPPAVAGARYAVEAGPLLMRHGVADFAPEREAFVRGVRILDEVTHQAAIGVRADGTVLLVTAEAMVAQDLVAVFERLEAWDAMRLDSGGSATLVADGHVLNRSVQRAVVNAIVWRPEAVP